MQSNITVMSRLGCASPPQGNLDYGCSPSPTMALALLQNTRRMSLDCSSAYTPVTNTPEPASDWPSVNGSWTSITGGSGSNPDPDKARPSASPYPADDHEA